MWRNRNVWLLMIGNLVASIGMWFGMLGNLEFMERMHISNTLMSVILMSSTAIGVVLAPSAGKMIDRSAKKKVMMNASYLRVIACLSMLVALRYDSLLWLLGYTILSGVSAAYYFPAQQAMIPLIVKKEELLSMNGLYTNIGTMARIVGTAIAGVLLVVVSLPAMYYMSMVGYVGLLVCTALMRVEEAVASDSDGVNKRASKQKASFKAVWPVLKEQPVITMAFVLNFLPNLFIAGFNLIVIVVSQATHDPSVKGYLYTLEGLAFMAGAFLTRRLASKVNLLRLVMASTVLVTVAQAMLYFSDNKWVAMVTFTVSGFAVGLNMPVVTTLYQKLVPSEMHGRWFAFTAAVGNLFYQIVMLSKGVLLDAIGFEKMSVLFAGLSVLLIAYYAWKQMRNPLVFVDSSSQEAA